MLLKHLMRLWRKRPDYPEENGVVFIHHMPTRGNIGDYLCSPRHYFRFTPNHPPLYIVGGGVFVNLAVDRMRREGIPFERTLLWGPGQSRRDDSESGTVDALPYRQWGIRDIDGITDRQRFLPCVSCLHPMLDLAPRGEGTLLFLNADERVSGADIQQKAMRIADQKGWKTLFNNCSEQDLIAHLQACTRIVTNSYHGAYWGLLSGRAVTLVGYSSKFRSLLRGFDLPDTGLAHSRRGDSDSLAAALENASASGLELKLADAVGCRGKFREINLNFANRLLDEGLISAYALKEISC